MQSYQANNPRTLPRRLDTCTGRECTQANRQLIANPSVTKVSRETHASRRSPMRCTYTTLLVEGGKPHSIKRREQSAPGRKTQPRTLPHTIPPHGGAGAWVTTTTAAAAATTANIVASSLNADNSSAAPKDDTETACCIAALLIPTRPKATERKRSENTESEKVDHRGEAERH